MPPVILIIRVFRGEETLVAAASTAAQADQARLSDLSRCLDEAAPPGCSLENFERLFTQISYKVRVLKAE